MGILKKIAKRRSYDATINGETVKLRPMTYGDLAQAEPLEGNDWNGWMLGLCLLEDDGKPAFERQMVAPAADVEAALISAVDSSAGQPRLETDLQFAQRVWKTCSVMDPPTLRDIIQALNLISKGEFEELAKN